MTAPAADIAGTSPRLRRPKAALAGLFVIAGAVALPILSLLVVALTGDGAEIAAVLSGALPRALPTTLWLLFLVALGAGSIGVTAAWIVVAYDFPLRRFFAFALVLPLAIPPYLAAYAFGDFFHFTGPVQELVRAVFGFTSARDYWFPEIRSTPGAAIVLSSVLFPYVYLTTRMIFILQGRNLADAARTLGARPFTVLRRVLLPVARPAIAAGVALALMETLNDVGASEYLGVRTLTLSVYATWLNRNSLAGAAAIAIVLLVIVLALIAAEQAIRANERYHVGRASQMRARVPRIRLSGWRAGLASVAAAAPVAAGFGVPVFVLGRAALRRLDQLLAPDLLAALANTVATAGATALLAVAAALVLTMTMRLQPSPTAARLSRAGIAGYAIPGTILAIGLLLALARFDNAVDAAFRSLIGVSTGLLLTGSAAAVVIACTIRFVALADGSIRSGMEKLPRHVDDAARSLGRTPVQTLRAVLLPLLRPAILTGAVLVFVDTVKELSATILLRPFGFSTLATHIYEAASRGAPEDGAVAALLVMIVAAVPVVAVSGALMSDDDAAL